MAASAKSVPVPAQADYGLDAPKVVRRMFTRGAMLIALGIAVYAMNRDYNPRGGLALMIVAVAIGIGFLAVGGFMVWSSRTGKLGVRDKMLDAVPWRGDEKVLDVGCGRGLLLIGIAKRLKSGRVTGVDIWNTEDQSGNSADATVANARAEGVMERVKIENGDARRLPFQSASYDVVVSSLALHNIDDAASRVKALNEILRVTKPGGHVAIFDLFHTEDYRKHLEAAGAAVVEQSGRMWLWCVPSRWVVVRKG